jgi:multicomponent Na+:H+ antiporter subunit E
VKDGRSEGDVSDTVTDDRPTPGVGEPTPPLRIVLIRGALLFGLWMVLMQGVKIGDLVVGALATVAATWASLRLLPPETGRMRFVVLVTYMPRFLWQSVKAGIDVAWRAFAPSLPLHTGFVDYRTGFPRGQARNNFATITSLMPGTVPAGDGPDTIEFHCLDVGQPVAAQMAEEERLLAKALEPGEMHG